MENLKFKLSSISTAAKLMCSADLTADNLAYEGMCLLEKLIFEAGETIKTATTEQSAQPQPRNQ